MQSLSVVKVRWLRPARVTPDTLNVAPALIGAPLARPSQRLLAIAIDGFALAVLSHLLSTLFGEPPHWTEGLGISVGWALAYFTLLPYWMRGQTPGKKLLSLRVVELTGRPLTLLLCFSRYGGYAAGLATGMFGFAQLLWDPNRQAIQDKIAHTVVVQTGGRFPITSPS
jgi:uncharacterized RDD family membrane protein YckC